MSPTDLAEIKSLLEADLKRLERQVAQKLGPVELDQTSVGRLSRMDALMNQGLAQASEMRAVEELRLVEDALERIENGTYGICNSCKRPIDVDRLKVLPEVRDCADCK